MTDTVDTFAALELSQPLLSALADVGYETPSPIQAACIPHLMTGADMLGEAQTGTGKTAAFALPLLHNLNPKQRAPQVLVLTPTRELAIQVAEAFQRYAKYLQDFHVLPLYGGQSMVVQLRQLQRGAQVIVGTPGRIMDHIERGSLKLDQLSSLVLDEADEMLRMGFIDDVEWILKHTPAERQTALFSATMPEPIRRVAHQYMRDPKEIKIKAATTTVATIRQRYWLAREVHKLDALTRILEVEDDFDAAIIFVRTKTATSELADKLAARGYAAAALNGDMNQALRERVIEQLKTGTLDIVVATDVAARGIDVPRITHVINYDIPYDTESYVHRIGRTGRAGRQGTAILFVTARERGMLRAIERATRQPIEQIVLPSNEALAGRRIAQFKEQINETLNTLSDEQLDFFAGVVDELASEQSLDAVEVAAALAFLAQRDRPLQLPDEAPELQTFSKPEPAPRQASREPRENRGDILAKRREFTSAGMLRYRIDVGRTHGATPKEIVGAIANEGGIEGRQIGQINLFDTYSTVELPQLPTKQLQALRSTRVRHLPINIRLAVEGELEAPRFKADRDEHKSSRPPVSTHDKYVDRGPKAKAPYAGRASTSAPYQKEFAPSGAFSKRSSAAPAGKRSTERGDFPRGNSPRSDAPRGDAPRGDAPFASWGKKPGAGYAGAAHKGKPAPKSGKPPKRK